MKIIGISLIRNEDIYINNVISNILEFCDEIIVLDNCSSDSTVDKIKAINSGKINLYSVNSPFETNKFIEEYYSTDTWMFGVDGDEIYDPIGLNKFKFELLNGHWNDYWHIKAAQVNVCKIEGNKAFGWSNEFGCRGSGKFYNFNKIKPGHLAFNSKDERLHGLSKNALYPNIKNKKFLAFRNENFRFLHLCFLNRSSLRKNKFMFTTKNPAGKWWNKRRDKYANFKVGKLIDVDIKNFNLNCSN